MVSVTQTIDNFIDGTYLITLYKNNEFKTMVCRIANIKNFVQLKAEISWLCGTTDHQIIAISKLSNSY